MPKKLGEVLLGKRIVHRVSVVKEEGVIEIERVMVAIPRFFKEGQCHKGKNCPVVHTQKKIDAAVLYKMTRTHTNCLRKVKARFLLSNMANRRSENTSSTAHYSAEGNLQQVKQFRMPTKGIVAQRPKFESETKGSKFPPQSLRTATFKGKFPSLTVIQTGSKHKGRPNRMTKGLQIGMGIKKSLRHHGADHFHKDIFTGMCTKPTSSEVAFRRRSIVCRYIPEEGYT